MPDDKPRYFNEIPLVPKRTYAVRAKHAHWHFSSELLSGRVTAALVALQLIHVGTGQLVPPERLGLQDDAPLVKEFHRAADVVTIPGSSLKGAIRSIIEMITYSAVSSTKAKFSAEDRQRYGESTYNSRKHQGSLDVAGKLFGAMGYQGQVSLADAPLITGRTLVHDIPPQYPPKVGDGRRYYPHALQDPRDRLWPLEVVEIGSRFHFTVQFANLSLAELGLLLIPLGMTSPPLCIKVGAGKSSGLGAVRFESVTVEQIVPSDSYTGFDLKWSSVDTAVCVDEAMATLVRDDDALSKLQADLGCAQFDLEGGKGQ
jgi:CRISPR/Cas system CSM-associated protein Csm3 (group 7 of RAMP superfamily)